MQGVYGGLGCILTYAPPQAADEQEFALLTQDNLLITTQLSENILATEV